MTQNIERPRTRSYWLTNWKEYKKNLKWSKWSFYLRTSWQELTNIIQGRKGKVGDMLKTRTGNLPITDKKMQSFLSPSSVLDHWIPKFFCIKFQKNIIYEREFEDAILHIITSCKLMYVIIHSYFFPVALRPNAGHGILILEVSRSHTTTHHSR